MSRQNVLAETNHLFNHPIFATVLFDYGTRQNLSSGNSSDREEKLQGFLGQSSFFYTKAIQ